MIRLSGSTKIIGNLDATPLIGRLTDDHDTPQPLRARRILMDEPFTPAKGDCRGFQAVLTSSPKDSVSTVQIVRPEWAHYLRPGDVVSVSSDGNLNALYRRNASANSLLVTERCSSNCIMCSQPPKARDDQWLYDLAISAVEHIPEDATEIGITGGEPLLNAGKFLALLYRLKTLLPHTAVHVLTNGRLLSYLRYAQSIAAVAHRDLMLGIPVYSASPARHDFVVQARGAFDQTIRGILNAKRCGLRVEIRVVLHRQTAPHLHDLARFLVRNLPFVDQVALMGLEHIGYVKANSEVLKAHPRQFADAICDFLTTLDRARIPAHLYNFPLCFVPEDSQRFARRSISDWKNDMPDACTGCAARDECCGFFSWNVGEYADTVQPFSQEGARHLRQRMMASR